MFSTGLGPLSTSLQLLCGLELGGTFAPTLAASMLIEDVGLRDFNFAVDRTWDSGVNLSQGDPCDPSYCRREPRAWGYCTNSSTGLPLPAIHSDSSMYLSAPPPPIPRPQSFLPHPGPTWLGYEGQKGRHREQKLIVKRLWIAKHDYGSHKGADPWSNLSCGLIQESLPTALQTYMNHVSVTSLRENGTFALRNIRNRSGQEPPAGASQSRLLGLGSLDGGSHQAATAR